MVGDALLGGGSGGPLRGAVSVAQRSGPPCCGVGVRTHPAEPRVGSFDVVIDAPFFKNSACVREGAE